MIILWILTGAIAGFLASLLTGNENGGCATDIVVGMLGSLIGGALEVLLRTGKLDITLAFTDFSIVSVLVSTIGAVILLGVLNLFKK